jgi:hypothetical protein
MDNDPSNDLTISSTAFPSIPNHNAETENKLDLGLSFDGKDKKKVRGTDGKFTKKT